MPAPFEQRANRIPWPPILYVLVPTVAFGLERLAPITEADWPMAARIVGAVLFVAGLSLSVAGALAFRSHGTPIDPTARAETLVTTGIYAWTRNPMYVGITAAYFGLGLALGSIWLMVLTPAMAIALNNLAIRREERHLEARFGDVWRAYAARVRRWV